MWWFQDFDGLFSLLSGGSVTMVVVPGVFVVVVKDGSASGGSSGHG